MFNHYIQIGVITVCERQLFSKTENTHINERQTSRITNKMLNIIFIMLNPSCLHYFFTLYYKDRNTFYNMVGTFVR